LISFLGNQCDIIVEIALSSSLFLCPFARVRVVTSKMALAVVLTNFKHPKYPFNLKKYANNQIPLKSSFDAPSYLTSLRASHAKPHHSSIFKTLKYFCAMFKCVQG